jgi:hypothetical protein
VEVDALLFFGSVFILRLKIITCLVLVDYYSSFVFQAFLLVREVAIC